MSLEPEGIEDTKGENWQKGSALSDKMRATSCCKREREGAGKQNPDVKNRAGAARD